jgi:hypothetical protein
VSGPSCCNSTPSSPIFVLSFANRLPSNARTTGVASLGYCRSPVFAEEEAAAEEAPAEPVEEEAPPPPPAKKMTSVEYLDTMYGGIGPENGKILGTSYPPAAIAMAKLGTPATLDFMR